MKYRTLIPPALIALLVISIFSTMKNNRESDEYYNSCVENARKAASYEIYVDAEAYYTEAISLRKDLDIYSELAEAYIGHKKESDAEQIASEILNVFPYEGRAYAISAKVYLEYNDYQEIFEIYSKYKKKNLYDEVVEEIYSSIKWEYDIGSEYTDVGVYSNGICAVKPGQEEDGWGYIGKNGGTIAEFNYRYAGPFITDIAPVETSNGIWYFLDADGNKKMVLDKIENVMTIGYVCDAIPIYNGEYWSYYSFNQEELCSGYNEAYAMANGCAAVKKDEGWSIIDIEGNPVNNQIYDDIVMDDKGIAYRNCYFAKKNKVYNMYNMDGTIIGTDKYEDARLFNVGSSLAAVKLNGKWGFVNQNGELVISPQYEDARSFSNGLAAVKVNDKWGFIDEDGTMVINNIYQDAKDMSAEGRIFVKDCGTWHLLTLIRYKD